MVIAIPRQRLPTVMAGFKSEDKHLAFRVKRLFAENRNFTARGQSNRKVCASFLRIRIEDMLELIEFDSKCGYIYVGCILLVNTMVGVTQGSLVSPGIADMVLSVIEEVNSSTFTFEAKRWLTFIIRWVDDMWFSMMCFCSKIYLKQL